MSKRIQRVSELLQQELAKILNEIFAENFGLVTVVAVNVTADFKKAEVYISCLDKSKEKEIQDILGKKLSEIQRQIGQKIEMKFTPKISFEISRNQEEIDRVEKFLGEIDHDS